MSIGRAERANGGLGQRCQGPCPGLWRRL